MMRQSSRTKKSPARRTRKPDNRESPDLVRLYVVDDKRYFIDVMRESPALAQSKIKLVGWSTKNEPALVRKVAATKADIVLIDIALNHARSLDETMQGSVEGNGLAACEAIKANLKGVSVMVWSHFNHAKKQALKAGADHFENDTLQFATLLQRIWRVARNKPILVEEDTIGPFVRMRLATRTRTIAVEDANGKSITAQLRPVGFALVWYLSLERMAGSKDWLSPATEGDDLVYALQRLEVWRHVASHAGVDGRATIPNVILNNWKAGVRDKLRGYAAGDVELFDSTPGRPSRPPRCSLVSQIAPTAIFVDDPNSVNLAMSAAADRGSAHAPTS